MRTIATDFVDALVKGVEDETSPDPVTYKLMTKEEQLYMWEKMRDCLIVHKNLNEDEVKEYCQIMRLTLNHFIAIVEERGISDDNINRGTERSGEDDDSKEIDGEGAVPSGDEVCPLPDSKSTTESSG